MNTQFLSKTISPSQSVMRSKLEIWFYGLANATLIGGASAVTSSVGLATAHGMGVADIPVLNLHTVEVIFIGGAATKFFFYLAQGLPALQPDKPLADNPPPSTN